MMFLPHLRRWAGQQQIEAAMALFLVAFGASALDAQECKMPHSWRTVWDVERQLDGEILEVVLDNRGVVLFEFSKGQEPEIEESVTLADLPEDQRTLIECLSPERRYVRIGKQVKWNLPMTSVEWQARDGVSVIKMLEGGTFLYLQPAIGPGTPAAVRRQLPPEKKAQALYLFLSPQVLQMLSVPH